MIFCYHCYKCNYYLAVNCVPLLRGIGKWNEYWYLNPWTWIYFLLRHIYQIIVFFQAEKFEKKESAESSPPNRGITLMNMGYSSNYFRPFFHNHLKIFLSRNVLHINCICEHFDLLFIDNMNSRATHITNLRLKSIHLISKPNPWIAIFWRKNNRSLWNFEELYNTKHNLWMIEW